MTALQQAVIVWLAVLVAIPIVLYVARAGECRRETERRLRRQIEAEAQP